MKDLLKYLEENKNPNLKTEVNYGFEYCLSLINEYQALQLQQTDVIESVCEINKEFEGCPLFKQYSNGCYGCKYRKQTVL